MKAYMWRAKNGDWLYMVGHYRDVQSARAMYASGGRFAIVQRHRSLSAAAEVARTRARKAPQAMETARRLGLPLAV